MNANTRWGVALALIAGVCWSGSANRLAASSQAEAEAAALSSYEAQKKAAAAARAKDPAWKPATAEIGLIQVGDPKKPGALKNFCLNTGGNILACFAPQDKKDTPAIRVYSPQGELLQTWPLEIRPGAICATKDGAIFVAGDGKVLKLDASGKVLASASSPVANEPVVISSEIEEMIKESGRPLEVEKERMKASLEKRRADVTGLAATEQDVFMAVGAPNDFTYRVYRFDHALANPKLVVEKLRGCCGQMDLQAQDGKLWIPHNARHCVETRDRDGAQIAKFGKAGKVKAADFGGCCEPKNLRRAGGGIWSAHLHQTFLGQRRIHRGGGRDEGGRGLCPRYGGSQPGWQSLLFVEHQTRRHFDFWREGLSGVNPGNTHEALASGRRVSVRRADAGAGRFGRQFWLEPAAQNRTRATLVGGNGPARQRTGLRLHGGLWPAGLPQTRGAVGIHPQATSQHRVFR
jgi:hypothetical protein